MNPLERIAAAANRIAQLGDSNRHPDTRLVAREAAAAIRGALREIAQAAEQERRGAAWNEAYGVPLPPLPNRTEKAMRRRRKTND